MASSNRIASADPFVCFAPAATIDSLIHSGEKKRAMGHPRFASIAVATLLVATSVGCDQPEPSPTISVIPSDLRTESKADASADGCPSSEQGGDGRDFDVRIQGKDSKRRMLRAKLLDERVVVEGDLILFELSDVRAWQAQEHLQPEGLVLYDPERLWPESTVPYVIEPVHHRERVEAAIREWNSKTNVQFVPCRGGEVEYVRFRKSTSNYSYLGRRKGGPQSIEIAECATTGNILHEMGHAVGLCHEQNREDRDQFVTIRHENIEPGREREFLQQVFEARDSNQYDYDSLMHYPKDAFGKVVNGKALTTIDVNQSGRQIGQRRSLSDTDIRTINELYPNRPR